MATKHTATDSRGKVHTRTSKEHVYSHAIVRYVSATKDGVHGEVSKASWASRPDLAEKEARAWRKSGRYEVEVIEATRHKIGRDQQDAHVREAVRSGHLGDF